MCELPAGTADTAAELLLRRVIIQAPAGAALQLIPLYRTWGPRMAGGWRLTGLLPHFQPFCPPACFDRLQVIAGIGRQLLCTDCVGLSNRVEVPFGVEIPEDLVS